MKPSKVRWILLILIVIVVSNGIYFVAAGQPQEDITTTQLAILVFCFLGTLGAYSFIQLLPRRIVAPRASDLLAADDRLPILYLRSFKDDGKFEVRRPLRFRWFPFRLVHHDDLESVIAESSAVFGPVVAIGRPGEILPPIGFARDYIHGDDWQSEVRKLISQSSAIVMLLGKGDGFCWEIMQIADAGLMSKVVVVIPPVDAAELRQRWEAFRHSADRAGLTFAVAAPPQTTRSPLDSLVLSSLALYKVT